jgi:hypothetical protein
LCTSLDQMGVYGVLRRQESCQCLCAFLVPPVGDVELALCGILILSSFSSPTEYHLAQPHRHPCPPLTIVFTQQSGVSYHARQFSDCYSVAGHRLMHTLSVSRTDPMVICATTISSSEVGSSLIGGCCFEEMGGSHPGRGPVPKSSTLSRLIMDTVMPSQSDQQTP